MNALINAANLLFVLGYFTTDMLRLRLLSVVGTTLAVTYFATQPEPIMTVVLWNLLFLVLNIAQVGRMLLARWSGFGPAGRGPVTP